MRDEKHWTVSWTQPYASWPKPEPKQEPEIFEGEQILPVLDILKDYQLSVNELFSWLTF